MSNLITLLWVIMYFQVHDICPQFSLIISEVRLYHLPSFFPPHLYLLDSLKILKICILYKKFSKVCLRNNSLCKLWSPQLIELDGMLFHVYQNAQTSKVKTILCQYVGLFIWSLFQKIDVFLLRLLHPTIKQFLAFIAKDWVSSCEMKWKANYHDQIQCYYNLVIYSALSPTPRCQSQIYNVQIPSTLISHWHTFAHICGAQCENSICFCKGNDNIGLIRIFIFSNIHHDYVFKCSIFSSYSDTSHKFL